MSWLRDSESSIRFQIRLRGAEILAIKSLRRHDVTMTSSSYSTVTIVKVCVLTPGIRIFNQNWNTMHRSREISFLVMTSKRLFEKASWRHVTTSRILSICRAPRLFCLQKNFGRSNFKTLGGNARTTSKLKTTSWLMTPRPHALWRHLDPWVN